MKDTSDPLAPLRKGRKGACSRPLSPRSLIDAMQGSIKSTLRSKYRKKWCPLPG